MPLSTPSTTGATLDSTPEGITGVQVVPFTFTMPAGDWEFILYRIGYQADATVITRFAGLSIRDDTGVLIFSVGGGAITANQLRTIPYISGAVLSFPFGIVTANTFPRGFVLHENWTILHGAFNQQAGDTQEIAFQFRAI